MRSVLSEFVRAVRSFGCSFSKRAFISLPPVSGKSADGLPKNSGVGSRQRGPGWSEFGTQPGGCLFLTQSRRSRNFDWHFGVWEEDCEERARLTFITGWAFSPFHICPSLVRTYSRLKTYLSATRL